MLLDSMLELVLVVVPNVFFSPPHDVCENKVLGVVL